MGRPQWRVTGWPVPTLASAGAHPLENVPLPGYVMQSFFIAAQKSASGDATGGTRLTNWQPTGTTCPICRQLETMQHALTRYKFFTVAAHVAMGPASTGHGPETDPTVIVWEQPELSLTTSLGITSWLAARAAWSQRCRHKLHSRMGRPTWAHFMAGWVKVLEGWEEHPTPTVPKDEIPLLLHALQSMKENTGRLVVSQTRSPLKPYIPTRKRKKKFENAEALAAQYEALIQSYRDQGWDILYPDGSTEKHPEVGWVGRYGVFFGDRQDVAAFIPLGGGQKNNQGELRAALCSLQGHQMGRRTMIYVDFLLVVNGS